MRERANLDAQSAPLFAAANALSSQIAPLVQRKEKLEQEAKDATKQVKKLAVSFSCSTGSVVPSHRAELGV